MHIESSCYDEKLSLKSLLLIPVLRGPFILLALLVRYVLSLVGAKPVYKCTRLLMSEPKRIQSTGNIYMKYHTSCLVSFKGNRPNREMRTRLCSHRRGCLYGHDRSFLLPVVPYDA